MSNYLKINYSEYQSLIPAIQAYRKKLKQECAIKGGTYNRVYTEKRTFGARSKFWMTRLSLDRDAILAFVRENPTIVCNGVKYEVSVKKYNTLGYYTGTSLALHFKAVTATPSYPEATYSAPSTPPETTQSTESNNQNNNIMHNNTISLFDESQSTTQKGMYINGKLAFNNSKLPLTLPDIHIEYSAIAEFNEDGSVGNIDVTEWYYEIDKKKYPNNPLVNAKYEDLKRISELVLNTMYDPTGTATVKLDQHIDAYIMQDAKRIAEMHIAKPAVDAQPTEETKGFANVADFVQELIKNFDEDNFSATFDDIAGTIASEAASEIESDVDNIVELSIEWNNQLQIGMDTRTIENIVKDAVNDNLTGVLDTLKETLENYVAKS